MLSIEKIISDYKSYRNSLQKYRLQKEESHHFYMLHSNEIDSTLIDYYENIDDQNKLNKIYLDHPILKTYLSLELIKTHYKEESKKYSVPTEFALLGKCALCISKNILVIYDIDNNINYSYMISDENIINYIKSALQKSEKYIADIYLSEISLLQVIYYEIMHDEKMSKESNKTICKRISNELNKARMFDNYYIDAIQNKNLPQNINDEYAKLIRLYNSDQITKEEYYKKYYYFLILSNQEVEKLYEQADDEHKEYIIDAYLELSSNNSKIHVRTTSNIINKQVLKRIKK